MRVFLTFIVSLFVGGPVSAQLADHRGIGLQFEQAQQYTLALYHYNKVAFDMHPAVDASLSINIGRCHLQQGDLSSAARFFDLAFFNSPNDSIKMESLLWKTKTLLAEQSPGLALAELLQYEAPTDEAQALLYHFYKGVCHFEMEQYAQAEASFLAIVKDSAALQLHFDQPKKFNRPNTRWAMVMSAVLPGSGQLYAKEPKEALNSVLINSIFIYYSIRIAALYTPLDAFIAVLPWFQRYYVGGYNRASILARERMYLNRQKYLQAIMAEVVRQNP